MEHCFLVKEKKFIWNKIGVYGSFREALLAIDDLAKNDYKVFCKWTTKKSTNN